MEDAKVAKQIDHLLYQASGSPTQLRIKATSMASPLQALVSIACDFTTKVGDLFCIR